MFFGEIKKTDIANGPGVRVSLFVSGCTHHCPGCFNADTWNFSFGKPCTEDTREEILEALSPDYIAGLSVLGGEPFEPANQKELLPLYREVRKRFPLKTIWVYSGYLFDREIRSKEEAGKELAGPHLWVPFRSAHCEVTDEILSLLDVVVDGKFLADEKDLSLRFRGSRNQRLVDVRASLAGNAVVLWEA